MEDSRKRCKFAVTKPKYYIVMRKGNNNSGTPVFSEVIKLLDRAQIDSTAQKMGANRYTKRLDAYQHLVIMLYATFAGLGSLREIVLGFLSAASRMNHLGLNWDSRNAIEIQIWVSLIAWLLMRVIQESTKRHWSVSNLMTAMRILLNSYMSLYDFLDCPERQWLELIKNRPEDTSQSLFPDIGGQILNRDHIHLQQYRTSGES